ncbi:MAG: protein kinase [Anaerolineae bacterium]
MTDAVPEKLGKYKIIEEVGRGGFAAVYKAVDTTLDRTVALKVLAPHLLWDPTFVQRFQREARVAANLDHSNIVTIYEVGQLEGVYFIAMQFLEGRTMSQILESEGAWPASRVQAIIEQVASALDYAHARGFVHRDIKPSNVIVASDGKVTLTDFGLVKAGEGTKLSTTGMVFGTPEYMSPEQAEGKVLDARSDIYSLGVVLYEMLAGRAPFVADTTPAVMYKHVHEPPPLDELPSDLPQGVVAVVEKALAKKREERYQGAGEMVAALQQAVSEVVVEEVKAPPEPVLYPSLTLQLSVEPQAVDVGGEAKWTVTLRNDGDDDLRHVTVRRGRTLLDEPFDLAVGKGRRFTFTTTYKAEGREIEKVTATGIASTGESVGDEARATVQVTPILPEPKVAAPPPVVKKPVPLVEPAAVAKEKPRPPTARPVPKAVPKKALGVGAAVAGGLVLLCVVGIIIFAIYRWALPPPTPEVEVTKEVVVTTTPVPPTDTPTATSKPVHPAIARGAIRIGVHSEGLWPLSICQGNSYSGFEIDLAQEIVKRLFDGQVSIEWVPLTSAERFPMLESGEIDLLIRNTTHTLSREEVGLWTSNYFLDGSRLLVRRNEGYTGIEDLNGGSVAAGTYHEAYLYEAADAAGVQITIVLFEKSDDAFTAFTEGRTDAFISDWSGLLSFSQGDPTYRVVGELLSSEPLAIGIPPNNPDFRNEVDDALQTIIADGTWQMFYDRWFPEPPLWTLEEMLAEPPANR